MPGWPAIPPPADPPPGARVALVVATGTYSDPGLRRLRSPARDAANLAQVLADPGIGDFAVTTVIDQPAHQVRLAVEDFLDGRGTGDLLLVYLSCHGLLDAYRRLYFAATDTRKERLGSTGVEAAWVLDQLEHCRARRQVLILDSCFSGAFAHGSVPAGPAPRPPPPRSTRAVPCACRWRRNTAAGKHPAARRGRVQTPADGRYRRQEVLDSKPDLMGRYIDHGGDGKVADARVGQDLGGRRAGSRSRRNRVSPSPLPGPPGPRVAGQPAGEWRAEPGIDDLPLLLRGHGGHLQQVRSTVRPVREVHPRMAATTARGPSLPELHQQPSPATVPTLRPPLVSAAVSGD